MKRFKRVLQGFICTLVCANLILSCSVDKSYDLSKDIDLTMALGSNGLGVTLGSTEKMYLRDIIKIDDSDMLDTITSGDNKGLYYLFKTDSSSIDVKVNSISPFQISPVEMSSGDLFTAPTNISAINFTKDTLISVSSSLSFTISDIPSEVIEIHSITFSNVVATIALSTSNSKFKLKSYSNLKIKFPDYVRSSYLVNHVYTVSGTSSTISMPVDSVTLPVDGTFGKTVTNSQLTQSDDIEINGNVTMATNGTVSLTTGETVNALFDVSVSEITPEKITGLVDPDINPSIDPIDISSDLPDFLQDDSVKLEINNPTIKFVVSGASLPVSLLFKGIVNSIKNDQTIASVSIPSSGTVAISKNASSSFYFSQTGSPFDPSGVVSSAQNETVSDLSTLIETIPDEMQIDLSDGNISTNKTIEHEIELGETYGADIKYNVLIPFQFNKGLSIVYNDSVVDMNKDLKDYEAEGVTITATAINTIPLNLKLQIIPCDVSGNELTDISVSDATVTSGSLDSPVSTSISVTLTPNATSDVSKIDKLMFKITASASDLADGESLLSSQYVQLTNLRIKLNGAITGNFN